MKALGITAAASIALTATLLPLGSDSTESVSNAPAAASRTALVAQKRTPEPQFKFCTFKLTRSRRFLCGTRYLRR